MLVWTLLANTLQPINRHCECLLKQAVGWFSFLIKRQTAETDRFMTADTISHCTSITKPKWNKKTTKWRLRSMAYASLMAPGLASSPRARAGPGPGAWRGTGPWRGACVCLLRSSILVFRVEIVGFPWADGFGPGARSSPVRLSPSAPGLGVWGAAGASVDAGAMVVTGRRSVPAESHDH